MSLNARHNENMVPYIHNFGIPLKSLTKLGTMETENNNEDYFLVVGDEQRDQSRLCLLRVEQLLVDDSVKTHSLFETKLDGSLHNVEALNSCGLFGGIMEENRWKNQHRQALALHIYKVSLNEEEPKFSTQNLKTSISLDRTMDTSWHYVRLVADRSSPQIAAVSSDKLLLFHYEKESTESFPLSPQDSCYWKPCGDWQPDNTGNHLMIGRGQSVQLWDVRSQDTRTDLVVFPSFGQILVVRYFPLRQHFLVGGFSSGKVVVWDIRSPSQPVVSWTAHHHAIFDIKSNGSHERLVASCGTDSLVHIWDMEELFSKEQPHSTTCVPCTSFEYHSDTIYALEWGTLNEFMMTSVGYDGKFIAATIPSFVRRSLFT
jgi:WD40 repeat protein